MDFYAWQEFFTAAGLGPNASSNYAHIFSSNKLERSHLPHLNREVLGELNISIMGHILMILKHARLVSAKNWPIGLRSPPSPIELSEEEVDDNLEPYPMPERPTSSQSDSQDSESAPVTVGSVPAAEPTLATDTQLDQSNLSTALESASAVQHPASGSQEPIVMEGSEDSHSATAECNSSDNIQQLHYKNEQESTIKSVNTLNGDGTEDSSDANSSLLPTPLMPHNWLDPSRKPSDSGNESEGVGSESSDVDDGQYSTLKKRNDSDEVEKDEKEVAPIIPEKICSPLLPTPVMPQNWLDPCKRSDDNSSDQSGQPMQPLENDSENIPVSSFDSKNNLILDANYLSSTSCPTFMEQPCSQTPLFLSETNMEGFNNQSVLDSPGQSFAQYSEQPIQERNFQPKIIPPWNKQARQTQPYYRPQPQSAYSVSSYTSHPNEMYSAPATMSTSSGYTYNAQPAGEMQETYQWNQ